MTTRGVLCNNPMNLMMSEKLWQGEVRPTLDPQERLCTFDSMENGVRGGVKTLMTYYRVHGLKTVSQMIHRYAPPVENNTCAYTDAVCEKMGVQPDELLHMEDRKTVEDLVGAIIHHEQGYDCCTPDEIEAGTTRALGLEKY